MADFSELTARMQELGMGVPGPNLPSPLRPAPIVTEEKVLNQRTMSTGSNHSDTTTPSGTTPSNSGKSTPISRKLSKTRSLEEVFNMDSPSGDALMSPMSKSRCTPPTSPYVSQRDIHPLTRKYTGELGIASDVIKTIEKADFSDDSDDDEEDDVIVLTDGEDNHGHDDVNGSFESVKKTISDDDAEPFEFLSKESSIASTVMALSRETSANEG